MKQSGWSAKETWIGELLQCPCQHGIGRHWPGGCEGDLRGSCGCRLTRDSVLEVAVELERDDCFISA